MLETLFWVLVGAFVGWHVPQPTWASMIKSKIMGMMSNDKK